MTADGEGRTLYVGNNAGRLARWQLDDEGKVQARKSSLAFPDRRAITALAMVLRRRFAGGRGRSRGSDHLVPGPHRRQTRAHAIHTLTPHASAVREIVASTRNKSLWSLGERRAALGPHDQ